MIAAIGLLLASLLIPQTAEPGSSCTDVHIVGVRGSGQSGYGKQVQVHLDAVAEELRDAGLSVSDEPLDYPALSLADSFGFALFTGAYDRSVDAGVMALQAVLDRVADQCPSSFVVPIGYSQGAQVIKQTFGDRGVGDRVLSVILLADPLRDITQPGVVTIGSLGVEDEGALGTIGIADHLRPLVIDVCSQRDSVCTGLGLDFASHIEGYNDVDPQVLTELRRDLDASLLRWMWGRAI